MEKHAEWCHTCGAKLKVIDYVCSYNEYTGADNIGYLYICPNRPKWWKFWESHPTTESEAYANQAG